nr:hypothetical protein [Tanacetum cinerariifolium]
MKDVYGDGDVTIHPTQIFSVNIWALIPNHTKGPPFTSHMLAICKAEKPVAFKSPRTSSQTEKKVSQGKNLRAKAGHKKQSTSSKQPPMSSTGGPTSLGVTSKEGAHPRLSSDKTKFVSDGLKTVLATPKTGTKNAAKSSEEIKLEDLAKLVPNVKAYFKDLDSPEDDPIIVVDDSKEDEEEDKNKEIHSTTNDKTKDISASIPPSLRSTQIQELTNQVLLLQSQKHTLETEKTKAEAKIARLKAQHPSPNVGQINELPIKSLIAKFSKILSAHDFYSSLPIELMELLSMFNELTDEVKALKTQVHGLKIKIPGDLKELPTKGASVQAKLKTLDALPSPLLRHMAGFMVESSRIKKAKKFDFVIEDGKHIHPTKEQINQQKEIEEEAKAKATIREGEIRKEEMIDLLGLEVVNKYYNDKL